MIFIKLDVFPACAGMNRIEPAETRRQAGVPRMRGDEPPGQRDDFGGWTVFPACAGMNRQ